MTYPNTQLFINGQWQGAAAPGNPPMPFDGKRMIFGGFEPVVEVKA